MKSKNENEHEMLVTVQRERRGRRESRRMEKRGKNERSESERMKGARARRPVSDSKYENRSDGTGARREDESE